jgi:hypothetical protein
MSRSAITSLPSALSDVCIRRGSVYRAIHESMESFVDISGGAGFHASLQEVQGVLGRASAPHRTDQSEEIHGDLQAIQEYLLASPAGSFITPLFTDYRPAYHRPNIAQLTETQTREDAAPFNKKTFHAVSRLPDIDIHKYQRSGKVILRKIQGATDTTAELGIIENSSDQCTIGLLIHQTLHRSRATHEAYVVPVKGFRMGIAIGSAVLQLSSSWLPPKLFFGKTPTYDKLHEIAENGEKFDDAIELNEYSSKRAVTFHIFL